MARILIIEDERKILRSLVRACQNAGHEVVGADNGMAGYELATSKGIRATALALENVAHGIFHRPR
jgi:DNA-binding response OmpR family regulator